MSESAWEDVEVRPYSGPEEGQKTTRLRVPGGWLYCVCQWGNGYDNQSLAFVPDLTIMRDDALRDTNA